MNLIQKLIEVRKSCSYLKKENKGEQYQYVSSSQTLGALKSKMDELGLLLVPRVVGKNIRESTVEFRDKYDKPKRQTTYFTELDMEYTWINADDPGDTLTSSWYGQGVDIAGEKGVGKALTYAEKYFMLKFFNIPTDKDDPDAFQKKHGEDDAPQSATGKDHARNQRQGSAKQDQPQNQAAVERLADWMDKLLDPEKKITSTQFFAWYEGKPEVQALKKTLDAEGLSNANRYYQQVLQAMKEREAGHDHAK